MRHRSRSATLSVAAATVDVGSSERHEDAARHACRRRALSVAIAACMLLSARAGWSQDSAGTDFWLGFARNNDTASVTLTLFITGAQNTTGTVAIPGLLFSTPFSVTAGMVTSVVVPSSAMVDISDVVQPNGIHVTAANEVTVYGLNRKPFTTDAFLGLPVDILGTDHIILSYTGLGFANNQSQFLIVGTAPGTVVTITPSATTDSHMAGVPYNVNLNAGDTYLLGNVTNSPT